MISNQSLQAKPKPTDRYEHWFTKIAREADQYLKAQDPARLGPAARKLLGYDK